MHRHRLAALAVISLLLAMTAVGCQGDAGTDVLTAEMPLHLEQHLDAAVVHGSEVPSDLPEPVEWSFNQEQPEWDAVVNMNPDVKPVKLERTDDALRLTLDESTNNLDGDPRGGIVINLPAWDPSRWDYIVVRARSSEGIRGFAAGFNTNSGEPSTERYPFPYENSTASVDAVNDGTEQSYILRPRLGQFEGPWHRLGLWVHGRPGEISTLEVLSIALVPSEITYADAPVGVRADAGSEHWSIYTHTPGRLEYRVLVPQGGRFDVGLSVLRDNPPVTFRVTVRPDGDSPESLIEVTHADAAVTARQSVDLSEFAGRTVTVGLENESERPGVVAMWTAPTVSGARTTDKPNVVFFIIDGGAADLMSVYGYNRRTTPNLERLAAEGAVFEHAYSNSSWTRVSTPSFMTSLQNSVLGGYESDADPLPDQAVTMAQHMHRAGYQTAALPANPYGGRVSDLQREVDFMRDSWEEFRYLGGRQNHEVSSRVTVDAFLDWRQAYPAEPYWVHFQTTDTHRPFTPVPPFAGLFVSSGQMDQYDEWQRQFSESGPGPLSERLQTLGIDLAAFYATQRGIYDETMAHTDYQIGRLIERIKAAGEWERTLFIVAADHGQNAAGLIQLDPLPPTSYRPQPILRSTISHIPMIVVWPGRIAGGQRFSQPVSMIDMLPTILDLVDLPMPEVMQGQSLAPLLLGEEGWEPRPVILDEFGVDSATGSMRGRLEVIDGRWGASLLIDETQDEDDEEVPAERRRPSPLLLFDLWNDPYAVESLHEQRPDLVAKYTAFLEEQWAAHQALGQKFSRSGEIALTPEQLRSLRALWYIQ